MLWLFCGGLRVQQGGGVYCGREWQTRAAKAPSRRPRLLMVDAGSTVALDGVVQKAWSASAQGGHVGWASKAC